MNQATLNAMIAQAYKAGVCVVHFEGIKSNGLASSSDNEIMLFLTRYPLQYGKEDRAAAMFTDIQARYPDFKQDEHLDSIAVRDGYVEITVKHLEALERPSYGGLLDAGDFRTPNDNYNEGCVEHMKYVDNKVDWQSSWGERLHTVLVPFERIISITV